MDKKVTVTVNCESGEVTQTGEFALCLIATEDKESIKGNAIIQGYISKSGLATFLADQIVSVCKLRGSELDQALIMSFICQSLIEEISGKKINPFKLLKFCIGKKGEEK